VPQEAWLVNDTVQENILFGLPYKKSRYRRTLRICQLEPDLLLLPRGDETEIGERGVNLSGGQQQRISLARAIYSARDIYLLDDPLSAVDQHVGKAIFDECINGYLRKKIVLFVTNQFQYLPHCDHIVFLEEGRISQQGSYDALTKRGERVENEFGKLLSQFSAKESKKEKGRNVICFMFYCANLIEESSEKAQFVVELSSSYEADEQHVHRGGNRAPRKISNSEAASLGRDRDVSSVALTPRGPLLSTASTTTSTTTTTSSTTTSALLRSHGMSGSGEKGDGKGAMNERDKLVKEEKKQSGGIGLDLYWQYIINGGVTIGLICCVFS
jgi:ABC-type multidrug transport system ATPase subunit